MQAFGATHHTRQGVSTAERAHAAAREGMDTEYVGSKVGVDRVLVCAYMQTHIWSRAYI